MILLDTAIEIQGHPEVFDLYFDHNQEQYVARAGDKELRYTLTDSYETIARNHWDEILDYCLPYYDSSDRVQLGDIFLHGKFIKQVK